MSKKQSNLKSLGEIISNIAPKLGIEKKLSGYQIHTRWKTLVGAKVAEHTCPSELKGGKLIVLTSSSVWLNELHYLKPKILKTLQELEPGFNIKEVVFKLGTEEQMIRFKEMVKEVCLKD